MAATHTVNLHQGGFFYYRFNFMEVARRIFFSAVVTIGGTVQPRPTNYFNVHLPQSTGELFIQFDLSFIKCFFFLGGKLNTPTNHSFAEQKTCVHVPSIEQKGDKYIQQNR